MNEYLLLKFAHIIAFVYWLGGDLGTFLASREVINRNLSTESRHIALKIMLACDMGPKLAMPLILPLGLHMAFLTGVISLPGWVLGLAWLVALYWFSVVLVLFLNEGKPFTARLSQLDFYFRILVVAVLLGFAGGALLTDQWISADWAAWKLLLFGAMVACGIAIRINLKPFIPAFSAMLGNGASEASDSAMEKSIQRCRPYVWCIWGGLFLNAALGIHLIG
jgi:hypothetical protein